MNYAATANRPNPVAALGALGVPAAFGAILVVGLAVKVVIEDKPANPDATFVPTAPADDPPKPVEQTQPDPDAALVEQTARPTRPVTDFTFNAGANTPISQPTLDLGDFSIGPVAQVDPPLPSFAYDPVKAAPRGDPGRWITDNDYRTVWINRGYSGVASFALEIDQRGRVTNCEITGSTGHSALDLATCRLLERRARFHPARDGDGAAVAGSYTSSVAWRIPE